MSRYKARVIATNDLLIYKKVLEERGVKRIKQYKTGVLKHFDEETVDYISYIWKQGDTFWKLSETMYTDPQYWYVIARFNNAPTEAHIKIGDEIKIPINLTTALQVVV
tara:strand:+ start:5469 stop:5792 length:324 start_codon:yes stop_codon:yes gene_type:complete